MGKTVSLLVGLVGLVAALGSGWYIVRGPFFGLQTPPPEYMLAACGVFIVAMYTFAWGLDGAYAGQETERPEMDDEEAHNQTLDMGFGPR